MDTITFWGVIASPFQLKMQALADYAGLKWQHQPFLLGDRFTLADASAYGQLSMNLIDGKAAELLEQLAPVTFRWLCMIRDGEHVNSTGEVYLSEQLLPLLEIIGETFTPLMRQNLAAYTRALNRGQTLFNEAAFDRGEALYDGSLLCMPFRAVAKTFQRGVARPLSMLAAVATERPRSATAYLSAAK